MGRRLLHWGPITALLIIGSLFLVALLAIVIWWFPNTLSGVIHALVFHFWVANILKHFFKSAFMGPGLVPFKWMPKEAGHLQYCQQCEGYKPPRAHHCKSCKRCVMKMDHHCPWVNNCVGHRNHRSFTLFLVYVVVGCSHCAIILICCIVQHLVWKRGYVMIKYDPYALIPVRQSIMLIMCFGVGLSAGVSIAVAFLLYHQIKSILTNATGIESWIIEKATRRERDDEFVYPYDLGMYNNFKQVMSWSHDYIGDGITWSVFEGCSQYELTIEQLIQKEMKRENTLDCVACNDYSGVWFPIFAHGMRVCWDSPWSEERRVPLKKGDVFYVTRWRKHWAYGERLNHDKDEAPSLGDERRVKGWVPRSCLVDEYTKKSQ